MICSTLLLSYSDSGKYKSLYSDNVLHIIQVTSFMSGNRDRLVLTVSLGLSITRQD